MSICVTSVFWVAVIRSGVSLRPVGFRQLWPWVVMCMIILFWLEFFDGILYFANLNLDEDLISSVQMTCFAVVVFAVAQLLLWSGTFLLRKVRLGRQLSTTGRQKFQSKIAWFVISELSCCLILSVWFLIAAWAGPMLTISNASYWSMTTVFYAAIMIASSSVIAVFYREPEKEDLPTPPTTVVPINLGSIVEAMVDDTPPGSPHSVTPHSSEPSSSASSATTGTVEHTSSNFERSAVELNEIKAN